MTMIESNVSRHPRYRLRTLTLGPLNQFAKPLLDLLQLPRYYLFQLMSSLFRLYLRRVSSGRIEGFVPARISLCKKRD